MDKIEMPENIEQQGVDAWKNNLHILVLDDGRVATDEVAKRIAISLAIPYLGNISWHCKDFVAQQLGVSSYQAWHERKSLRIEWMQAIEQYRGLDPARICREMFSGTSGVITGIQNLEEFRAANHESLFSKVVGLLPKNKKGKKLQASDPAMQINLKKESDWIIEVGIDLDDLQSQVEAFAENVRNTRFPWSW